MTVMFKRRLSSLRRSCLPVLTMVFGLWAGLSTGPGHRQGLSIPKAVPAGFAPAQPPEFYGTESEPLADGHIFHFIDGGGVVYLSHGFRAVVHLLYKDKSGNRLTVDIFNMGKPQDAAAAFADETICPAGYKTVSIGTGAKSYHFEPDFFLYFVKGRYLVYAHISSDDLADLLIRYAKQLFEEDI